MWFINLKNKLCLKEFLLIYVRYSLEYVIKGFKLEFYRYLMEILSTYTPLQHLVKMWVNFRLNFI